MSELENLKNRIDELEKENKELKKLINKRKCKVGRKNKFKEHDIEAMKFYRFQGSTLQEIADLFNCSVGLVHKLVN